MNYIGEFQGPYRFLSNFWPAEVTLDGVAYPTVEHAFQAAKTLDAKEREAIRTQGTPGEARKHGKLVHLRSDWETIKVDIMRELLRQKFSKEPLRSKLLMTNRAELVEGNHWNDTFWGVYKGVGHNQLGLLLMGIRAELRRET